MCAESWTEDTVLEAPVLLSSGGGACEELLMSAVDRAVAIKRFGVGTRKSRPGMTKYIIVFVNIIIV
jgi:hypothetical protein